MCDPNCGVRGGAPDEFLRATATRETQDNARRYPDGFAEQLRAERLAIQPARRCLTASHLCRLVWRNLQAERYEEVIGLGGYGKTLTILTASDLPDPEEVNDDEELGSHSTATRWRRETHARSRPARERCVAPPDRSRSHPREGWNDRSAQKLERSDSSR
jgi:hypothetical protein